MIFDYIAEESQKGGSRLVNSRHFIGHYLVNQVDKLVRLFAQLP